MTILLLLISAYMMGFLTAIPVGATQIEIAKRALNHKFRAAWMVALGSVASDGMYGTIALFGLAPFFSNKAIVALFEAGSVIILWVLAFFTFREARKPNLLNIHDTVLASKRLSLLTGFGLSVTNPMMVFWWLVGVRFAIHSGIIESFTQTKLILFLVFGCLGLGSYLSLLAVVLYKMHRFISDSALRTIYRAMAGALLALSCYFLYHSIRYYAK